MVRVITRDTASLPFTDPPPPRVARRITIDTPTRGHRLVTVTPDGYLRDIRGWSDPTWWCLETQQGWGRREPAPENADPRRTVLIVMVVEESTWYAATLTGAQPIHGESWYVNAAYTWFE